MTKEECIKNNICPFCEGKIYLKLRKGQVKCTCENGTYIDYYLFEEEMTKRSYNMRGDQWKTWGITT